MPADTHIHLVRHGHVHNAEKVFYGRLPRFRLSCKGVMQARETARPCMAEEIRGPKLPFECQVCTVGR